MGSRRVARAAEVRDGEAGELESVPRATIAGISVTTCGVRDTIYVHVSRLSSNTHVPRPPAAVYVYVNRMQPACESFWGFYGTGFRSVLRD